MNLKQILTTLFFICCLQGAFSQALLSSQNLDLKKAAYYHEILTAPEANDRGLSVFATDKNTITALHYTRVLYYKDSLATERPDTDEYNFMAGYSYNNTGQPSVYFASNDLKKIQELHFDFETQAVTDYSFEMPFKEETVLTTFSENNSFYILTMPKLSAKLRLYIFNEGRYIQRVVDFSKFEFKKESNALATVYTLLDEYGIQKTEYPALNTLAATASKIKLYVVNGVLQFTFNHNTAFTQVFTVDPATYAVTEKIVKQAVVKDGKSNAFLHNNKLYQIVLSDEELQLSATDIASGEFLNTYKAGVKDTITFKNSPLLEQTDNQGGREFKTTKKFLRKAALGTPAISVYQTPNDFMVSVGTVRSVVPAGDVIMGAALGGAIILGGGDGGAAGDFFEGNTRSAYFESLFDDSFNHKPLPQQRLAADYIGQYIANHKKNITLETVFSYDYYYVLGFYDAKAKKYVLVKFQDDFVE